MNDALKMLFVIELRRQWTITALLAPLLFLIIGALIIFLPARFMQTFNVSDKLLQSMLFLLPVVSAFFCVGIVSNDVKDGWLRTLLVRAIKREHYLLVKLTAALASIWATVLFAGTVPLIIGTIVTNQPVEFDVVSVVSLYALSFGISLTYVSILTFISCWLPGVANVAVLIVWGILASASQFYVTFTLWDVPWAVILQEFIFPNGFFEAIEALQGHTHIPFSEILWGLVAVALFLSLSFWSITKIQVDRGAE